MGLSKKRKERNTWPAWGVLLAFSPLGKSNKKNKIPKKQKAAPAWGPCFLVIFFLFAKDKKTNKAAPAWGLLFGFYFFDARPFAFWVGVGGEVGPCFLVTAESRSSTTKRSTQLS